MVKFFQKIVLGLCFCAFAQDSFAQILTDTAIQPLVQAAVEANYNLEFKEAEEITKKIKAKYPNHPVTSLIAALGMYWQYLPVSDNPKASAQYVAMLNQCIAQAEVLAKAGYDVEANFFLLACHSFLAMLEADKEETLSAVSEAKKTYSFMKKGMLMTEKNPEFYFSTGLFNYYIVQYPHDHPIVRPFMFFFQDGDKKVGLQQLESGAKKATFTKTESAYYLIYIFLKHENAYNRALQISENLHEKYPANPLYETRLAESLLFLGKYDDAQIHIKNLYKKPIKVINTSAIVFDGITQEKKFKNDKLATEFYLKAVATKPNKRFTSDYLALAHCGLARIAERNNQKDLARKHYKKALDLSEYASVIAEAKGYLR